MSGPPATANGRAQAAQTYAQQVAAFNKLTRNRNYKLPGQTRSATNLLLRFDLPPSYLIGRIKIEIRGVVNAAPTSVPDVMGLSKIVKNVKITSNMGDNLVDVSGPQYFGLFAPVIDFPGNAIPHSTAWTSIVNGATVTLPIVLPMAVNLRDATGLLPAQNRQTVLTLWVELETDANLGTGTPITWTTQPTVTPTLEVFTIPFRPEGQPPISMIHRIIGLSQAISAGGDFDHVWDRGNIVLQKIHGAGYQVASPADSWTRVLLKVLQTDNWYDYAPNDHDTYYGYQRLQQRRKGTIAFDFVGQSGLGIYDIPRDALDMRMYTDVVSRITATGAITLDTVTRYLQPI